MFSMVGMTAEAEVTEVTSDASTENAQLSYRYRDADLKVIWHTSVPKDNEAALAYFHVVTRFGKEYKPVYVERITRDKSGENEKVTMLKWMFDPELNETKPFSL